MLVLRALLVRLLVAGVVSLGVPAVLAAPTGPDAGSGAARPAGDARPCPDPVRVRNKGALDPWFDALRARSTRRADVLLVGDSITEGVGTSWDGRLPVALQQALRSSRPLADAQGVGHVPALTWSGLRAPGLRRVGATRKVDTHGLGGKAVAVPAGSAVELTFTGTRVRVWWGTAGGSAPGTVSIDGDPVVPMAGAGELAASGREWLSPVLGEGVHRVRVAGGPGRSPLLVEGFEVLGSETDRTAGVHVFDGSHGGWSSHGWVPALSSSAVRHWQAAAAVGPDLTVVHLGVNDWFWHTTPARVRRNLAAIVSSATAAADGPHAVLVVVPFRVVWDPRRWPAEEWRGLRAAIRGMAGGDVAVLDLQQHWPQLVAGGGEESGVMLEDRHPVHPNVAGHRRIAGLLASVLAPGAPCA